MLTKNHKQNEGFTIIEVLIVLAIAGLILLIVFLAVPALQRNARNTSRKADASSVASAYTTFTSNNNGAVPTGIGAATTTEVDFCAAGGDGGGAAIGATACGAGNSETGKISYYTPANIWVTAATTASVPQPAVGAPNSALSATNVTTSSMVIELNASCGTGVTATYSSRAVSVWYVTESANGNGSLQCVGS